MIVFVIGTSAEAIKVAPLARRLNALGSNYECWLTMQHGPRLIETLDNLSFQGPRIVIPNGNAGKSLKNSKDAIKWLFSVNSWFVRNYFQTRAKLKTRKSIIVVHGDTLTTVIGTIFAKLLGVPSAHIEAGLRSGDWRNPFPEELDRRIAGIFSTVDYVPTQEAIENLSRKRNVVFTHGNTAIDAVLDGMKLPQLEQSSRYAVCLLHRFELLSNPELVRQTLQVLENQSSVKVRLFLDEYSGNVIRPIIANMNSVNIVPEFKLPYTEFVSVLAQSEFVVTDSGGIQAEAALLGVPTLIHRMTTEQFEGLGKNIELSKWDILVLKRFVANYLKFRKPPQTPEFSPTKIILEDLKDRGYLYEK